MKIGFVSLPYHGHLNPMIALARKIQARGHEVVFIGVPDVGPFARAAGIPFFPYCEKEFPEGSIAKNHVPVSKLHGVETVQWFFSEANRGLLQAALEHLPHAIAASKVEALALDTVHYYLELVPIALGIPYAHVWNVLPIDMSGITPPGFCNLPFQETPEARAQYLEVVKAGGAVLGYLHEAAVPYATRAGLKIDWNNRAATASPLAMVTQIPKEFDFPVNPWPSHFHYAGPFSDNDGREPVPFAWEKLDGRPLVYASLGTLVNGIESIYKTILAALGRLSDVQVVLSIGKNVKLSDLGPIPSNFIVVDKAPQIELLKRATLCVTHAGLNTTLESLAHGVPMVAIPVGFEQPGIASRIAYHKAGELIEVDNLTVDRLHALVDKVLHTPAYRESAQRFKNIIAERNGLNVAAEAIEQALGKALANRIAEVSRV